MSRYKLKTRLQKYTRNKAPTSGLLGDYSGYTVEVSGRANYVYVRLAGNILMQAFNNRVPNRYDRRVLVGYDPKEPHLLQVLGLQSDQKLFGEETTTESQMMLHHESHEWMNYYGGNDVVFTELRQFMPFRPMPIYVSGTHVYVNRGVGWIGSQWQYVTGQIFNVGPYIPVTGTNYGLLYIESNGSLNYSGSVTKDANSLVLTDIPAPPPGTLPIMAVRLYGGQTTVSEALTGTDIIDLRFPIAHDHKFRELSDVPRSYTGQTGKFARVKSTEDGLEYISVTGGSLGLGHIIADEGVNLAQQGIINFVGLGVTAANGSTTTNVHIPGTVNIFDGATFKVSGTALNFGDGLLVKVTGTTAYIDWTGTYGHVLQDEGTDLAQRTKINFVGAGVTATDNVSGTVVTILGMTGTYGHQIQDDGAAQTQRNGLNFVGTGFVAYDSATATIISGTASGHTIQDDGVAKPTQPALNFVGAGFAVYDSSGATIVSGTSGGGGGHEIQDDGVAQTTRPALNFVGTNFVLYDSPTTTIVSGTVTPTSVPAWTENIDGALATGTDVAAYVAPGVGTIVAVYIRCKNKGSAGSTIVDVHKNGTTIFTTQASRPTLLFNDADGVAKSGTPDVTTVAENDVFTFDIDGVATGAEDLSIGLAVNWSSYGSSGGGHTIQDDGVGKTQRTNLNFVGTGFSVYDDAGGDATIVSGTSSGINSSTSILEVQVFI